jgi:hypothetical protein
MRAHYFILSAALAALFLTGCGSISEPSKNQMQLFSGTVSAISQGGDGVGPNHTFNVSKQGEVTVRFTSLTPLAAVVAAILGQPVSGGCAPFDQTNVSGLNRPPFSNYPIRQTGMYCFQIFDPGNLTTTLTYTVEVSHP